MTNNNPVKMFLLERQKQSLKAYIGGGLKDHFLSANYLDGICEQRNLLYKRQTNIGRRVLLLATLLTFFGYFSGREISIWGINIPIVYEFASVLGLLVAASLFAFVLAIFDLLLMDIYLAAVSETFGIYSPEIFFLHKTSTNLWTAAFTPKFFGPKSAKAQHWVFRFIGISVLLMLFLILLFPTIASASVALSFLFGEHSWTTEAFSIFALILLVFNWTFILLFFVRYKFEPADFYEHNLQPTPEFIAKAQNGK